MDSRQESGNQADSAAHHSTQCPPDEAHYLKEALQGANNQIMNLHGQMYDEHVYWERERLNLCHKVHNGRYRANRLHDLMGIRETEFKEELQRNIQTISKQELEISRLNTSLKLKDVEIEAAKRFNKEQMEKKEAQLAAERQINSELRDQIFKASLESQKTVSLQKDTQMRLDLATQQVQQRDDFIQALRKEKEGLSERLLETSAQLKKTENESFQKDPQEEKFKALQEKFTKEMEEKEKFWASKMKKVEQEKSGLVEENQKLFVSVEELEKENKVLIKTAETLTTNSEKQAGEERTLITRVQEVETEKEELVNKEKTLVARIEEMERETKELQLRLNKKKKKKGFWSKSVKGKTEEEKEKEEMERKQREEDEQKKKEQKKRDKKQKARKRSFWNFWSTRDEEREAEEAPCSL